jgi:hypothetical protein
MTLLAIGAVLLLQVPTGQPPRDTLRMGAPRDTFRVGAPAPAPPASRPRADTIRFGAAPPVAPPVDDTLAFDAPATRDLVRRVSQTMGIVPAGLTDYRARMESSVYLTLRADSASGGELPLTVDEFAGAVSWARTGELEQRVTGHRIRQLAPTPYTIGSWLESPWVVPHLYGSTVDALQLSPSPARRGAAQRAIHPFSLRGPEFYRYTAEDTVRVRTQEGVTTLVAVAVRPRGDAPGGELRLLAGTFYLDADRAAIARARFGFTERQGRISLTEAGLFFELENALVGGQYWLPVRQRREIQVSSPILGGATALRLVTALSRFDLNTGWRPDSAGSRLVRDIQRGETAFAGWRDPAQRDDDALRIGDFADLREAIRPPSPDAGPIRVGFRAERSSHILRYNRVEGLFLGAGARVEPRDPARRSWDVYGTGGYAFAEGTARGELSARLHPVAREGAPQYTLAATGYRRLRDTRVFRPAFEWELGYALGSALGGTDRRDYFDATGGELFLSRRRGPFTARLGGRVEEHDTVTRNTETGLLGGGDGFEPVAAADRGTHSAVEGELRYARGAGAFGITRSLVASLWAEAGVGDFRTQRVTATLATRRPGRYVTLIARGDAGLVAGEAPPQFLIRFGGGEGLRGYDDREFAGSTAALARGRLLLHLPPYGNRPLFQSGIFLFPPLRPALALSGDVGWSEISDESEDALRRLGGRTTDGTRSSYGVGLSLFEDAVSIERVWPSDGGEAKWYAGFTTWF